jgi:hypothetical protein
VQGFGYLLLLLAVYTGLLLGAWSLLRAMDVAFNHPWLAALWGGTAILVLIFVVIKHRREGKRNREQRLKWTSNPELARSIDRLRNLILRGRTQNSLTLTMEDLAAIEEARAALHMAMVIPTKEWGPCDTPGFEQRLNAQGHVERRRKAGETTSP